MENMTALLAQRLTDDNDTAANVAEDALEIMERMDLASKHRFLSLLLIQAVSAGKIVGMPVAEE